MRKLKIYLDTSIWNFIYADDCAEKQEITILFFENISKHEIYISNVVIEEIEQADLPKRKLLEELLSKYKPKILEYNEEIKKLSQLYILKGIIPEKKYDDAMHVAYATYYELDILLTWNYKHLANIYKKKKIMIVNLEQGYDKPLELITPLEVIEDEKN